MPRASSLPLAGALALHAVFLGPWFAVQAAPASPPKVRVSVEASVPTRSPPPPQSIKEREDKTSLESVAQIPASSPVLDAGPEFSEPLSSQPEAEAGDSTAVPTFEPEAYRRQVREAIAEKKVFPSAARVRGQQGTVVVRFTVEPDGSLKTAPMVVRSSGFSRLDAAATAAVSSAAPFLARPSDFDASFDLPVEFVLNSTP